MIQASLPLASKFHPFTFRPPSHVEGSEGSPLLPEDARDMETDKGQTDNGESG